jgi:hypothetical protein
MKKQEPKVSRVNEGAEAPRWVAAVLRLAGDAWAFENRDLATETSDTLRLRCRQAAGQALTILKLRRERQRVGFLPVPLTDYIQGLAEVAEVSLSQVIASPGIEGSTLRMPECVAALGRLAREIGMSLRETLTHLRIGFAAQRQSSPMTLLAAHRHAGDPRRSQLEDCEDVLSGLESEYDARSLRDLRTIQEAISEAYQGGKNGPT